MSSKAYNCFKCGQFGNVVDFIQILDRCDLKQAIRISRSYQSIDSFIPPTEKKRSSADSAQLPFDSTKQFKTRHLEFLRSRRYEPEKLIKQYDLYVTGPSGDFKHRIIIPVFYKGEMVTYVGRDFTGRAEVPYKNCPDERSVISPKKILYNLDETDSTLCWVEGFFDVARFGEGAVCSFGTKWTSEQLALLIGKKRLYIWFDGDAQREAKRLASAASAFIPHVENLNFPEIKDPDSLSDAEMSEIKEELGF
jgi:DNA primase